MPPRIPTLADFAPLSPALTVSIHFPSPPESTTSFLILLHGLGDSELPFASFARNLSLPGVLALSVRGTSALPLLDFDSISPSSVSPSSVPPWSSSSSSGPRHWGDDVRIDPTTGEVDDDPGFDAAAQLLMRRLIGEVIIDRCGWETSDVLFFGFGQGGSLALGLAAAMEAKGAVSIGGPLPMSMIPSSRTSNPRKDRNKTPVLVCQLPDEHVDAVREYFDRASVVNWRRSGVAMPRDRDEMFPIMKFFADQLNKLS